VYRRQGICEYVVWRVLDEQVDWFCLVGGNYEPLLPDNSGLFKSKVFPGLWLDPLALVKWDFARVFLVVQQGTASREHAEFVALLESRRKS
ncbi:MAG TPA: hypothetical protein VFI31_07765, partial [Pirellulales bacterium]|nr:hypothetical protein [Pirellulales bacterium]